MPEDARRRQLFVQMEQVEIGVDDGDGFVRSDADVIDGRESAVECPTGGDSEGENSEEEKGGNRGSYRRRGSILDRSETFANLSQNGVMMAVIRSPQPTS
jgi:hypothetical protein